MALDEIKQTSLTCAWSHLACMTLHARVSASPEHHTITLLAM